MQSVGFWHLTNEIELEEDGEVFPSVVEATEVLVTDIDCCL